MLYVLNGFFKGMLKLFLFLLIGQVFVFERFFLLECHIFGYLIIGCNWKIHVDSHVFLLGCNHRYPFLEHGMNYVFMKTIIDFMFHRVRDEATIMMEPDLFTSLRPPLPLDLFLIPPPIWVEIPFTIISFLSLSLLFGLFEF